MRPMVLEGVPAPCSRRAACPHLKRLLPSSEDLFGSPNRRCVRLFSQYSTWLSGRVPEAFREVYENRVSQTKRIFRESETDQPPLSGHDAEHICVLVDKGSALPQRRIDSPEIGLPNIALPQLRGVAPAEGGKPPIVGPYTHGKYSITTWNHYAFWGGPDADKTSHFSMPSCSSWASRK